MVNFTVAHGPSTMSLLDSAEASQVNGEIKCGPLSLPFLKSLVVALFSSVPLGPLGLQYDFQFIILAEIGAVSGDCIWPLLP